MVIVAPVVSAEAIWDIAWEASMEKASIEARLVAVRMKERKVVDQQVVVTPLGPMPEALKMTSRVAAAKVGEVRAAATTNQVG